jgi:hypothetical protein
LEGKFDMKKISLIIGLLLLFISPVFSTNFGTIEGKVTDSKTGQPVIGANILMIHTGLGTVTDASGAFVIRSVPAGKYGMAVSMMGFEKVVKPDISVESKRATHVDVELVEKAIESKETVTISGTYFDKTSDAVLSSHTLSSREIRSSPGSAEDVFRILKTIPGVGTTGSRSANLIVRGGDQNENLTLLDNLEIRSPLHFSREDVSMGVISIIDPALIKNVEFLTGGFPAQYGDKLSSVFELKIKEGNQTQFNRDVNVSVGGFSLYLDGPLSNNGNVVFSVRRGIFDLLTRMMDRPVKPRYWDMLGKATFHLGTKHTLSLVGFYYADDAERTQIMADHGMMGRKYPYSRWDDNGSAVGLNWQYLFSEKGYALTTAEWTANGTQSNIGTLSDQTLNGDDSRFRTLQLKTQITYKASPWLVFKTGGYVKSLPADYKQWRAADTLRNGLVFPGFTRQSELSATGQAGIFVQGLIRPAARLEINSGLRFDRQDVTDESNWSPRLGMSWHLTEKTSLNAAWGLYVQGPSALQLAKDKANVSLKSSQARHVVLGVEHLLTPDSRITFEAYDKSMNDLFVTSDTSNVLTNQGSGYARGLEWTIQKKMSDRFLGSLAYTWSFSRRKDGETLPEYSHAFDRRHNITAVAEYDLFSSWRVGVKVQYASGNPYTPVTGTAQKGGSWVAMDGSKNSARFPDFQSLDLRVDRSFRFSGWTLKTYIEVWNVLNHKNVLDYTYLVDDQGNVSRDSSLDFPIMPMVGLSAQF